MKKIGLVLFLLQVILLTKLHADSYSGVFETEKIWKSTTIIASANHVRHTTYSIVIGYIIHDATGAAFAQFAVFDSSAPSGSNFVHNASSFGFVHGATVTLTVDNLGRPIPILKRMTMGAMWNTLGAIGQVRVLYDYDTLSSDLQEDPQ